MPMQIIAMGGGGFSMEPENLALDRYVLAQTEKINPRICFLGQASAEHPDYIINFYNAFNQLYCKASHLSLFKPHTADIEDFLLGQDVIYVGGGNTRSMLALWREWGLHDILRTAAQNGTVLAGISAGAICWFEYGLTDSIPGQINPLKCLGYLPGTCSPHYDGEESRRPAYHRLVGSGEAPAGIALDDGTAAHYVDGERKAIVTSREGAGAYWVQKAENGDVSETPLEVRYLLAD